MIFFYPIFSFLLNNPNRFDFAFRVMRVWSWILTHLCGLFMSIDQKEKLPSKPFIICPNHSSYLDIILMYRVFSGYFLFMGKAEITSWPLFNIFFTKGMNIAVDRSSNKASHQAFERAKAEADKGHNLVIFPEGTIPPTVPKMRAFKNGAFKLAIEKNIPIVPVTFINNWKRLQAGPALKNCGGPGFSEVIIHPAVYPKDYAESGLVKLKHDIFETIEKPLRDRYGD
jgi:1-acyl-sn-glycerol-3-phosphate acyltransferase